MATVSLLDAFTYKWAQTGTAEALTDDQWKVGWAFIGATPPSVEQFNRWGQVSDEKSNYLYAQLKTVYDLAGVVPGASDVNSLRDSLRGTGLFTTAAPGTNTTAVATTAFVQAAIAAATGRRLRTLAYKPIAGVQNVSINGGAFAPTGGAPFTPLAATSFIRIRAQGGGSSGGGADTTGASQYAAGLGGQGGAYGEGIYTSGFSSLAIVAGVGGPAPAAGNTAGIAGGTSSAGALLSAPGGTAPPAAGPANTLGNGSVVDNAPSAMPSGANLVAHTGAGGGFRFYLTSGQFIGSRGGAAGDGGSGPPMQNNGAGTAATNPGAGGSAGTIGPNLAGVAGGAGGDGYVIIEEFA